MFEDRRVRLVATEKTARMAQRETRERVDLSVHLDATEPRASRVTLACLVHQVLSETRATREPRARRAAQNKRRDRRASQDLLVQSAPKDLQDQRAYQAPMVCLESRVTLAHLESSVDKERKERRGRRENQD